MPTLWPCWRHDSENFAHFGRLAFFAFDFWDGVNGVGDAFNMRRKFSSSALLICLIGALAMNEFNSPEFNDFVDSVGRLTLSWAMLEFGLDMSVLVIYHHYDGKKLEPEMPRALQRKLKFLKESLPLIPWITEMMHTDLIVFLDDITAHSEIRHDMVHGVVSSHTPEGTKMVRLMREKNNFRPKTIDATPLEIMREANWVNKLTSTAMLLAQTLTDAKSPNLSRT